jgi:hypothetical protein
MPESRSGTWTMRFGPPALMSSGGATGGMSIPLSLSACQAQDGWGRIIPGTLGAYLNLTEMIS